MDNNNFGQLITPLSTIFFLFILGFIIQKRHWITNQSSGELASLIVGVLLPLYLFYTTSITSASLTIQALIPIIVGIAVTLLNYGVALLAVKSFGVGASQRSAFTFSNMFSNTAFLGIPVCLALFGEQGAIYAVLYDFGTGIVILTLGIWELTRKNIGSWTSNLLNPLIWSVILGAISSSLGLVFPEWIAVPLKTLGQATLPLAILICGTQIGNVYMSKMIPWKQLSGLIFIRLLISPFIAFVVLGFVQTDNLTKSILIIAAAMPVGLSTAIFTKKYGADADFASLATIFTTFLSIITLPLIFKLLGYL